MCNPNSSVANRRFRTLSTTSSALRKNLGSIVSTTATATTKGDNGSAVCGGQLTQNLMRIGNVDDAASAARPHTFADVVPYRDVQPTINGGINTNTLEVVVDGRHYYPSTSTYYGEEQHHHVGTSSYSSYQRYQPHEQHQQRREDQADHTSYYPTNQAPSTSAEPPEAMVEQKTKPKRRRKPQKPGLTAKNQERHFVHHDYHDHVNDQENDDVESSDSEQSSRRRGGVAVSFPLRLHAMLERIEADGYGHICSWQPHGRCFLIHKPQEFTDIVLPTYFRQTKLTSFQRQLNLYGYQRITRGPDAGSYYNELFLRGKTFLCKRMQRTKVKGTKFKAASNPEEEPDFYKMTPVPASARKSVPPPQVSDSSDHSDEDASSHDDSRTTASSFEQRPETTSGMCYNQYSSTPSDQYMTNTPSNLFIYDSAPLSPMVNGLAAATFGMGSPVTSVQQHIAPSSSNYMMPVATAVASSNAGVYYQSPVDAAAAAIFPSPSLDGDEMLDSIVNDLFFDGSAQGASAANQQQQALDEELIHFVHSFDPDLSSILGDGKSNDISDYELGNLLERMIDPY